MHRAASALFLLALTVFGSIGGGGGSAGSRADATSAVGGGSARRDRANDVPAGAAAPPPAGGPIRSPGGTAFRFPVGEKDAPRSATDGAPPFSLTATDGPGLALVAVDARGVLEPPLALTAPHPPLHNPR